MNGAVSLSDTAGIHPNHLRCRSFRHTEPLHINFTRLSISAACDQVTLSAFQRRVSQITGNGTHLTLGTLALLHGKQLQERDTQSPSTSPSADHHDKLSSNKYNETCSQTPQKRGNSSILCLICQLHLFENVYQ